MNRHRLVSLLVMAAMVVTSLLPAAGVVAAPLRAPAQVNVAGSFEESIGGSNWTNNDPLTDMADANGDGVWKFAATPAAGNYEYKIVENGDWGTSFPADNVAFSADGSVVTWRYDQNDHFVSDTTAPCGGHCGRQLCQRHRRRQLVARQPQDLDEGL